MAMSQQPSLWDATVNLPVSGTTPEARHAGSTGARRAAIDRGPVALAYRELLIAQGPLSDHEAARILGRMVSSMCSTRNGWGRHVQPSEQYEATEFGTRRVRWRWVP